MSWMSWVTIACATGSVIFNAITIRHCREIKRNTDRINAASEGMRKLQEGRR